MFFCNLTADWLLVKKTVSIIFKKFEMKNEKSIILIQELLKIYAGKYYLLSGMSNSQPCPLVFYLINSDQWSVGFFYFKKRKILTISFIVMQFIFSEKKVNVLFNLNETKVSRVSLWIEYAIFLDRGPRATYDYLYKLSKEFRLVFLANLHMGLNWD